MLRHHVFEFSHYHLLSGIYAQICCKQQDRAPAGLTVAMSSSPQPPPDENTQADPAALYETTHVHEIYAQIAPHFSQTRHKPWPLVSAFLLSQPPGSVGLDVGCGNGKYLSVNPSVYLLGSDRSAELVSLARDGLEGRRDREVVTADGLSLPYREGCADFVISVAVVHHFSTRDRRVDAVRKLLRCLRRRRDGDEGGRVLVYVWALEQGSSRRGWDEGGEQDLLVPWVMKNHAPRKKVKGSGGDDAEKKSGEEEEKEKTFQRYYHLYRKGELEEDVVAAGGVVLQSGYEKDNWWAIAANAKSLTEV